MCRWSRSLTVGGVTHHVTHGCNASISENAHANVFLLKMHVIDQNSTPARPELYITMVAPPISNTKKMQ